MKRLALTALAALLLGTSAGLAADHALTIKNEGRTDLLRVVVHHGTIAGFKPLPAQKSENVTVTLPDGTCKVDMVLTYSNGTDDFKFDFCTSDKLTVW